MLEISMNWKDNARPLYMIQKVTSKVALVEDLDNGANSDNLQFHFIWEWKLFFALVE